MSFFFNTDAIVCGNISFQHKGNWQAEEARCFGTVKPMIYDVNMRHNIVQSYENWICMEEAFVKDGITYMDFVALVDNGKVSNVLNREEDAVDIRFSGENKEVLLLLNCNCIVAQAEIQFFKTM